MSNKLKLSIALASFNGFAAAYQLLSPNHYAFFASASIGATLLFTLTSFFLIIKGKSE